MNAPALTRPVLRWVAAAVLLAALPHTTHLPLWVSALVPAALLLRLGVGRPPGRWVLVLLVLLTFGAVLAQFRTIAGITAGGGFLSAMMALKFLETRNTRDAGLLLCLSYFLAIAVFLHSQSIPMAAWVLGSTGVTTVALMTLAAPAGPPVGVRIRQTALLFGQAAPIMLVLFLLFPRLPGPLWGTPESEQAARTGLSDRMAPGSITQLTQSSEVAFRVQFGGDGPPQRPYYWRGPVFWQFDGRAWTSGQPRLRTLAAPQPTGPVIEYTMLLSPHQRRWLFGLDMPLGVDGVEYGRTAGYALVAEEPVDSVIGLRLRSALDYRIEPDLPSARRERALALPEETAPRARQMARRWRAQSSDTQAIVDRALSYFREREFVYTLSPPATGDAPVDNFLFGTRSGFCEHYASAFTVLMRSAGVPARVVTGYLGGETNDMGDYLIVRQSDAHAWAEVWLPEAGWTRVDPTEVVSRERLDSGIAGVSGAPEQLPLLSRGDGWIKRAALAWDAVEHAWNRTVVGYGAESQQRLLSSLGLSGLGRYAIGLLAIVTAAATLVGIWLLAARRGPTADPAVRAWERALARLHRAGIPTDPCDGPRAVAARVRSQRPDLAPAFGRITRLYIALRYRPGATGDTLKRLRAEVRQFKPR